MKCQRCGAEERVLNPLPETGEFVCDACYGEASRGLRRDKRPLLARPSVRLTLVAAVLVGLWLIWHLVEAPLQENDPAPPVPPAAGPEPKVAPAPPGKAPPAEAPAEPPAEPAIPPEPEPAGPGVPDAPVAPDPRPALAPVEEPEEPETPSALVEDTDAGRIAYATIIYPSPAGAGASVPPVAFSHRSHALSGLDTCAACHNGEIFAKTLAVGVQPIAMDAIFAGRFCGACHNGRTDHPRESGGKVFAADPENESSCKRCHAVVARGS
ncbi:MAG: hypothetical protein JXP34_12730 [Planctomycetes bacterium]|nr:hypothetical protein [Planctomycetota bacterium]